MVPSLPSSSSLELFPLSSSTLMLPSTCKILEGLRYVHFELFTLFAKLELLLPVHCFSFPRHQICYQQGQSNCFFHLQHQSTSHLEILRPTESSVIGCWESFLISDWSSSCADIGPGDRYGDYLLCLDFLYGKHAVLLAR